MRGPQPVLPFNAAFAMGSSMLGIRNDPYMGFNFIVEFEGLIVGGFSEVTGLEVETEVHSFREGGMNERKHELPGPSHYPSRLVLKHGLTDVSTLWTWHQDVVGGPVRREEVVERRIERQNGTIYLLDRLRLPAMWWDVKNACPVKWSGPELKADSGTLAVETLELIHEGITRSALSLQVSAARFAAAAAADILL